MKRLKAIVKKVIIVYVIIFLSLSSLTSCQARKYDEECGKYISDYTRDFIEKYCTPTETKTKYVLVSIARWSGGTFGSGIFEACCNTGVRYMYEQALGVDLADFGWANYCSTDVDGLSHYPQYWEEVTNQEIKPGDIVLSSSHTEMYVGNNENANFGNSPHSGIIINGPRLGSSFSRAYRPKFDVNPTGTIPSSEWEDEDLSIYDDNGFIYKGVATLQGYKSSSSLKQFIINMLSEILDYFIGMQTFLIRAVIVGWTAIIERFVVDGIVNAVTGITNKRDTSWEEDPTKRDEIDEQADRDAQAERDAEEETQPIGNPDDPTEYVSAGMQNVSKIGGNAQLKTTSEANVTIENIVYNKIPILDINFFNFESAGGAVVDKDGIIYIIKENVALWYYIFRILSIVIMLAALIYLGTRTAITTISEKKAIYQQMMISWLVGFILIFAVSYIMYITINLNEAFIDWIIPRYEDRTEISLYESVKTKAYSLKATTGFTGMIMYIVLVYYAIRFLFIYFKRFITIMILALLSPFVSVAYAIEGINKKGKGGAIYKNWFKSFTYTVLMQSIHALVYTIFILIILKLTETSLVGIVISFIFLHYMVEIDVVFRKVFGFTSASGGGLKPTLGDRKAQKETLNMFKGTAKNIGRAYGNYATRTVARPIGQAAGRIGTALDNAKDQIEDKLGYKEEKMDPAEYKKAQKTREANQQKFRDGVAAAGKAAQIAGSATKAVALGALVVPSFIAERGFTAEILGATIDASRRTSKLLSDYGNQLRAATAKKGTKYSYAGGPTSRVRKPGTRMPNSGAGPTRNPNAMPGANNNGNNPNAMPGVAATGNPVVNTNAAANGVPLPNGNNNPENIKISELTEAQRTELINKLGITNLKLIEPGKTIGEVLEETQDIEQTKAYAELLAETRKKEEELESEFKKVTDEIASKIESLGGEEFASALRQKAEQSLAATMKLMSKPLSERDILRAMQDYQSKTPQFKPTDNLSQADIEGITKELNKVLSEKNEGFQMTKEFERKLEKEIIESQKRAEEERTRREKAATTMGQDMSGQNPIGSVVEEEVMTMTTEGKKVRKTDRELQREAELSSPNSPTNRNAPQQNADSSQNATERLVKNIINASKSLNSKETTEPMTKTHKDFSQKLEELRNLADQLSTYTDEEEIFDLDSIFKRLEVL